MNTMTAIGVLIATHGCLALAAIAAIRIATETERRAADTRRQLRRALLDLEVARRHAPTTDTTGE